MKVRTANVSWQQVEDEIVVLDLDGSAYFKLNETGAVLWQPLLSGTTEAELVGLLCAHFDIDEAQATADVQAFCDDLRAHGLLESP